MLMVTIVSTEGFKSIFERFLQLLLEDIDNQTDFGM